MKVKKLNPYRKYLSYVSLSVFLIIFAVLGIKFLSFSHAQTVTSEGSTCVSPTTYPPPPVGGMTYTNWDFNTSQSISSLQFTINIFNDPGDTSDLYLQLYDANIDNTGQYFGLQTTGTIIFSQWGNSDLSNIELGPGATETSGTETGSEFISLRYAAGDLPVGQYTVNMERTNYDGTGDWFAYYVTFPGQPQRYIGSIRFPRANPSVPASFHDGGGSWTEFWDNNGDTTLYPVPLWHVNLEVRANNGLVPNSAISSYSTMPNSDIYAESPGGYVDFVLGGSTPRCHTAGYLWQNINQTPTSTPQPTSTTPAPTSTPTKSTAKSGSSASTSSGTTTTTPATSSAIAPSTPSPSTTPTTTTSPLASISIKVTNTSGQKLANAKVVLNNTQTSYTNSQGVANFSAVASGANSITVTKAGSKPVQEKITLTPGENEMLAVKLTSNSSNPILYLALGGVIILILAAGYLKLRLIKQKDINKHFPTVNSPPSISAPIAPMPADSTVNSPNTNTQNMELPGDIKPVVISPNAPNVPTPSTQSSSQESTEPPKPTVYPWS